MSVASCTQFNQSKVKILPWYLRLDAPVPRLTVGSKVNMLHYYTGWDKNSALHLYCQLCDATEFRHGTALNKYLIPFLRYYQLRSDLDRCNPCDCCWNLFLFNSVDDVCYTELFVLISCFYEMMLILIEFSIHSSKNDFTGNAWCAPIKATIVTHSIRKEMVTGYLDGGIIITA